MDCTCWKLSQFVSVCYRKSHHACEKSLKLWVCLMNAIIHGLFISLDTLTRYQLTANENMATFPARNEWLKGWGWSRSYLHTIRIPIYKALTQHDVSPQLGSFLFCRDLTTEAMLETTLWVSFREKGWTLNFCSNSSLGSFLSLEIST